MNIYKAHEPDLQWKDVDMDDVKDTKIKVVVGEKEGAPNFIMRVFKVEPNGHTPLHSHDWEHENYILEGEGVLRNSKGEEIPIKKGDVVFVPPLEEHQYFNNSDKPLKFICLIPKTRK